MEQRFDRREVLVASGAIVLIGPLAGCEIFATEPEATDGQDDTPPPDSSREAPALTELVESGELPPVEERLPTNPLVVEPIERVGTYGGEWRNALIGAGGAPRLNWTLGYENPVRWNLEWDEIIPNVVESFEISDDGRRYTLMLREGVKWSDGELFTADDIMFAYNDILLDERVSPVPPSFYVTGGEPATLDKLDDHTVQFTFAAPHGLFLEEIASRHADHLTRLPRHYLEQYHIKYNPDADVAAKTKGHEGWAELLQTVISAQWQDPELAAELPRLYAWLPRTAVGDGTQVVFDRNPYYWKTDPDGRQLPYIDGIVFDIVSDAEVLLLKVLQGEIDMMDRYVNTTQNKPVLARNREDGDYRFFDLVSDKNNTMAVMLNLTCQDEIKREIFRNKDFRIGLSHAINREEIIDAVHRGQGEPWQVAPSEGTDFYDKEMAKQYTEYDVDLANEFLDRAGYVERNDDGIRLGPDGEPIAFSVDASLGAGKPWLLDGLELVKNYWREVGIDIRINSTDVTLWRERLSTNQHDAAIWEGDGGLDVIMTPYYWLPASGGATTGAYAPAWGLWYSSAGAEGEEPPVSTRQQMELYDELKMKTDPNERTVLMKQILDIAKEEFYQIGISTAVPGYGVVKNNFRNMVDTTYFAGRFPYPGVTKPEQYSIEPE